MGWNSTQRHGLRDEVYHVSIPNGIEFYLVACFSLRLSFIVSIPNGMEFYPRRLLFSAAIVRSFNSQRDGILQKIHVCFAFLDRVSIPNGMEFYQVMLTTQ